MRLVIADTGPVNYLILIGHIELLPHMFDKVALPRAVQIELSSPRAPLPVKHWITTPPAWLEIHDTIGLPLVSGLDDRETAAIALAEVLHADLLLMDERDGVRVAKRKVSASAALWACSTLRRKAAKHTAAKRWVTAVNNWGQLGSWVFHACYNPQLLDKEMAFLERTVA